MNNKEIQEKRMKGYFIQATKQILKSEGIKCLSVRNISEQAGYSYTTLYNYFKDINDLIFFSVNDFFEECKEFVNNQTKDQAIGIEKLQSKTLAYVSYFVEYPSVFELFFLEKVSDFGNKQTIIDIIVMSLDKICTDEWEFILNIGKSSKEQLEQIKLQLKFIVVGMLVNYLNRRTPVSYSDFIKQVKSQIEFSLTALYR